MRYPESVKNIGTYILEIKPFINSGEANSVGLFPHICIQTIIIMPIPLDISKIGYVYLLLSYFLPVNLADKKLLIFFPQFSFPICTKSVSTYLMSFFFNHTSRSNSLTRPNSLASKADIWVMSISFSKAKE